MSCRNESGAIQIPKQLETNRIRLSAKGQRDTMPRVKLQLEKLPASLEPHREALRECLVAMDRALPLRRVLLFGSHARGEARPDSDVDLCLVADGATEQVEAGTRLYASLWGIWPRPGLTLVPITPSRLQEKQEIGDFFYDSVLKEGVPIATEDRQ